MRPTFRGKKHSFLRTPAADAAAVFFGTLLLALVGELVGVPSAVGVFLSLGTIAVIVAGIVGGIRYSDDWRPRWEGQRLVERTKLGSNPLGSGYAVFLVTLCPISLVFHSLAVPTALEPIFTMSVALLCSCLIAAFFGPRHVAVDLRGVLVEQWYGWRHVPWRHLRSVEVFEEQRSLGFVIPGETLLVRLDEKATVTPKALATMVERARPPMEQGDGEDARWSVLDRSGKSLTEWIVFLRQLLHREGGFRDTPITKEDLERLLMAEDTPSERKIAAAIALMASVPEEKERVRIVSEHTENPQLRTALRAAMDDSLEEELLQSVREEERIPRS